MEKKTGVKLTVLKTSTIMKLAKLKALPTENERLDFIIQESGKTRGQVIPWENPADAHQEWVNNSAKMSLIHGYLNDGKQFDWEDDDQEKWLPWYWMDGRNTSSGSGVLLCVPVCGDSLAYVASRLHLFDKKHVPELLELFPDTVNAYMLG